MPVSEKVRLQKINSSLGARIEKLLDVLEMRNLNSSSEGCARGSWMYPERMAATKGDKLDISLAVEDFKSILAEIKKL